MIIVLLLEAKRLLIRCLVEKDEGERGGGHLNLLLNFWLLAFEVLLDQTGESCT